MRLNKYQFYCGLVSCYDWICSDPTRPHINGVSISVKSDLVTIAATDGHGLARYQWTEPDPQFENLNIIIHGLSVKKLINVIKSDFSSVQKRDSAKTHYVNLDSKDGKYRIQIERDRGLPSDTFHIAINDVEFPPIDQVIPKNYGEPADLEDGFIGIGAELLCRATQSYLKISYERKGETGLMLNLQGRLDPMVITSEICEELLVVVMPMRIK